MKKIIVNGTFDIVHSGHIKLLNFARSLGSELLVAIDTDQRVKELKGSTRPINNQDDRKFLLQNLKSVSRVELFNDEEDLIDIIINYQPDIMVKGSDYFKRKIVGAEFIKEIIFMDVIDGYSTTNIIQRITDRR